MRWYFAKGLMKLVLKIALTILLLRVSLISTVDKASK